jgi:hypothetical protein
MCTVALRFHCSQNNIEIDFIEMTWTTRGVRECRLDISGTEQKPVAAMRAGQCIFRSHKKQEILLEIKRSLDSQEGDSVNKTV